MNVTRIRSPYDLVIAPFILIPFIENAFKHLSHDKKQEKWIDVKVVIKDTSLEFEVRNSTNFEEDTSDINDGIYNGLGLKNVNRRLDIVYANNYTLSTIKKEDTYSILLKLQLASNIAIEFQNIPV